MGTFYSAADYRANLKNDFGAWSGKDVIVRDHGNSEIARGVLGGFQPKAALGLTLDGGQTNLPGCATYDFESGGALGGRELVWDPTQTIEVL